MTAQEVQYKIALLDGSDHSVDIESVYDAWQSDLNYRKAHSFTCPCCGAVLLPVLGEIRQRHFRHDSGTQCDPNYYLHSTAEQVFYEEYQRCLNEGIPFTIDVYSIINCAKQCPTNRDVCKKRFVHRRIVLTDIYKKITPEERVILDGRFRRPDLLLESEDGKQLWVEIWVSHKTDEKKRQDGNVLEIKVGSVEDIQAFGSHELKQERPADVNVRLYLKEVCQDPDTTRPAETYSPAPFSETKRDEIQGSNGWETTPFLTNAYDNDATPISFVPGELKDIRKTTTPELVKTGEPVWVDLGLPSGTLWSKEYMGNMSFDKAMSSFPNSVPTPEQYEELVNACRERGLNPAGFVGRNGKFLEVYEGDFWTCQSLNENEAVVFHREFVSKYNRQVRSYIEGNCFAKADKRMNLCVRLVKLKI